MTSKTVFDVAMTHIPALATIAIIIYAAYWLTGMISWPRLALRDRLSEKNSIDFEQIGGYHAGLLAAVSLASLFLELLLVRWIASEIRVFAYFKSLALIACFLGFGLGCYLTRRRINLLQTFAPLTAMVAIVEIPWEKLRHLVVNLSGFIGWLSDMHLWGRAYFSGNTVWGAISAGMALCVVIALFGLITITFIPFGQLVGGYLERAPKGIRSYSINVLASIAGIAIYTLLCFLSTPPFVWFAAFAIGMVATFWRVRHLRPGLLGWTAVMIALFAGGEYRSHWWGEESWKGSRADVYREVPGTAEVSWSPYQKLTIVPLLDHGKVVRYVLNTNDTWYQEMVNLSPEAVAKNPSFNELDVPLQFHQYNLPYRFYPNPPSVLIAGAGMGNDVAGALRNNAGHVTAVEIDPLIYAKGRKYHFEHPYDSSRVEMHVNDARAFVQQATGKYDLIIYSILDSHTTSSYYTNIRLDSYVYTLESMKRTRELLNPDGVFVVSFSSERPWFAGRLQGILAQAFGKPPLMVHVAPEFFIISNGDRIERALAANPQLREFVASRPKVQVASSEPTTDDWPYLYQQNRSIPIIVWVLSIGLILVSRFTFGRIHSSSRLDWHFFFLGAAFMLLEVQIISKATLLFGSTWLVNSIVVSILLASILLANITVSIFPNFPRWFAYAGLFASLGISYFVPASGLFFDTIALRGGLAVAIYCVPAFFAGIVFIASFREAGFSAESFGSNLFGSLVGGLLESLSFVIGIKALVICAGVLYFASAMTRGRSRLADTSREAFPNAVSQSPLSQLEAH